MNPGDAIGSGIPAEPLIGIIEGTPLTHSDVNDIPEDTDPGFLMDQEITGEDKPAEILPERKKTAPKSGAPTLDEWQSFFSRIVVRFLTDGYIAYAFRGIDENALSERDLQKLKLNKDERDKIAVPFSEYANKSPFARKHGRQIVAAVDSLESVATLAIWMGRVNRIARKYRPQQTKGKAANNVRTRQAESNGHDEQQPNVRILNPNI